MTEQQFEWASRIRIDPGVQAGKPVIAGRRVPVYVLVGGLAAGDSMEDMCEGYSVSEEDVRAALAYATEVLCAAFTECTGGCSYPDAD